MCICCPLIYWSRCAVYVFRNKAPCCRARARSSNPPAGGRIGSCLHGKHTRTNTEHSAQRAGIWVKSAFANDVFMQCRICTASSERTLLHAEWSMFSCSIRCAQEGDDGVEIRMRMTFNTDQPIQYAMPHRFQSFCFIRFRPTTQPTPYGQCSQLLVRFQPHANVMIMAGFRSARSM